jgi:UDP-glucose 4-epimerase
VDAVVYLAQSRRYREFPAGAADMFAVNVAGAASALEWSRVNGVKTFIYASAAGVYASSGAPLTEDSRLAPASFYARSKQAGEILTAGYAECFRCVALRIFTVYGPGQTGMLVASLIERIRLGESIDVEGTRGLPLSPIYVDDVAGAISCVLDGNGVARGFSVFNLGGPGALTIRDMAMEISSAVGRPVHFTPRGDADPAGFVADNSRIADAFGFVPSVTFAQGIRLAIQHDER